MSGEQLELGIKIAGSEPLKEQAAAPPDAKPKAAPKAKPKTSSAPEPLGRPTLYLVDGPNLAFRAHYGIRGLTNSKGQPTNALYGYCSQVFKLLKEYRPDYLVICWDPRGGTFRNEIFPDYKGTRPEMPDELRLQMPRFPDIAAALGIRHIVVDNYEADDVIGTLAVGFKEFCNVTIVTGDKDMMQLVDGEAVTVLDTMKEQRIGPKQVVEKWGVRPDQIIDILSLMGDSSDNIPGVARIGKKGAADLIQAWGSMEEAFVHAEEVTGRNRKPLLAEGALESARLSYTLATITTDMDLGLELEDLAVIFPPVDRGPVTELFQEFEFHRFLTELGGEMNSVSNEDYRTAGDEQQLRHLIGELRESETIALSVETDGEDPNRAKLLGLSFCVGDAGAWYVPFGHNTPEGAQLPRERVLLYLKAVLENPSKRFVGHDLGFAWAVLQREGIRLSSAAGDAEIGSFLMNAARKSHEIEGLALTWLSHKMPDRGAVLEEVGGNFADLPLTEATELAAVRAHVIWLLRDGMKESLQEQELTAVYEDIDLPLVPVLAEMQIRGIRLNTEMLADYSRELAEQVEQAQALTWEHAGREFNSSSPKQLAQILFDELQLPVVKRTKTGPSTDASVLEELATLHPLPEAILRYRSLTKLKSTYVDALPPLVNPETGRIHTHYSQTVAATGRLSSRDPNLQNIPIRTPEGRRIREAFIPDEGHVFLSADYSQVELRILAHLCGGEGGFARAFAEERDVHRITAAEVFSVPLEEVTPEMRSTAKAINFGLVYGQTEYGLSRALHISRDEAKGYIARYKEQYPEIETYMETTVAYAREHGHVRTLLGRRRPVSDLTSSNFNQRQAARRVAINTPVQGTAADVIKMAMLRVDGMLSSEFPSVRMLLQVHDELVFEVPEGIVDPVRERVVQEMESACELLIPLKVGTGIGTNWDEAH